MNKKITAADIARIAGVSRSTVTGVINDYPFIAEKTKERIRAIIKEYGYAPNMAAQALAGKKQEVLGHFIIKKKGVKGKRPFISDLIAEVIYAASARGFNVITDIISPDETDKILTLLQKSSIRGAIITGGDRETDSVKELISSPYPLVFMTKLSPGDLPEDAVNKHIVNFNDYLGACSAVEHLLSKGHREILHVAGPVDRMSSFERQRGFRDTMTAAGFPDESLQVLKGSFNGKIVEKKFVEYMESASPRPTAVFAVSDAIAMAVVSGARSLKIRIPDELSVVGFGDFPSIEYASPALTTIRNQSGAIAERGIEILLQAIEKSDFSNQTELLPTELICRESVADLR